MGHIYDIVVVGSGAAGLRAAVEAAECGGLKVAVMSKIMPVRSATGMAEGGINGVTGKKPGNSRQPGREDDDSLVTHARDTLQGGDYLGDREAIDFFVEQCPRAVFELDCRGMPFNRNADGTLARRKMGGHTHARTCFSGDRTGQKIVQTIFNSSLVSSPPIKYLADWQLLDLAAEDGVAAGVVARNIRRGDIEFIRAGAVILATGGYARLFWGRTTNPYGSTGDGVAAALRAGLRFKDPEMIQFHPTGFAGSGAILTEAARAEGGYLLNAAGERFMEKYDPERMELSVRDVVARAIETEIKAGRGAGADITAAHVFLDLTHLEPGIIRERLANVTEAARHFENIDPARTPIPVKPTAHYTMGGIEITDYRTMTTAFPGIFAAGECACVSIHGANRLGGNSLAGAVVTGRLAGMAAAEYVAESRPPSRKSTRFNDNLPGNEVKVLLKQWPERWREVTGRINKWETPRVRDTMAAILAREAGIFRNGPALKKAAAELQSLSDCHRHGGTDNYNPVYNTAFTQFLEVENMLVLSRAVVAGALERQESRGSHFRLDFPGRDDHNQARHTLISLKDLV